MLVMTFQLPPGRSDSALHYTALLLVLVLAASSLSAKGQSSPSPPVSLSSTNGSSSAVASASGLSSSPTRQAGVLLQPFLHPGDFNGYPISPNSSLPAMPFANCSYRIVGPNLLPLTPNVTASIALTLRYIYGAIKVEVPQVDVVPTPSAPYFTVTDSADTYASALAANTTHAVAYNGNFGNVNTAPSLDQYQSVDVTVYSDWTPNSSWPVQGAIENTYNQFTVQVLAQMGVSASCYCLEKAITPESAPIVVRLGIPRLASYIFTLQVIGPQVPPMDVRKQVLIAEVLNSALLSATAAGCLRTVNVSEAVLQPPPGSDPALFPPIGIANLTMVASEKDLTAPPFDAALKSLIDTYVLTTSLRSAGLNVSASILSISPFPGDSLTDKAAMYSGVSIASAPAHAQVGVAATGSGKPKGGTTSTGEIVGIAVGVTVAAAVALLLGTYVWRRRRKGQLADLQAKPWQSDMDSSTRNPPDLESPASMAGDTKSVPLGQPPCLTEFQKAAIQYGVPGMSEVAHNPLHSSISSSTDELLMPRRRSDPTAFASKLSGSMLTGHNAGSHVHGWDVNEDDIEVCRRPDGSEWVLGTGSFGKVMRAVRSGMQDVAVKMLTNADDHQLQQFRKEISILKSLSFDRNIVQFYGACVQGGKPMLVLEYMEGGDLRQAMSGPRGSELTWYAKGALIALDVSRGLHFLHSNRVMHSDLKAKNVLLTKDLGTAKIGDVGLARIMSSAYMSSTVLGGTFAYAAPELLINEQCTEKVDIYSFGVLLWEIITRESPQRGHLRRLKVPEECPAAIVQVIDDCLEVDPSARPTARELFNRIKDAYEAASGGQPQVSVSSLSTVDSMALAGGLPSAVSSRLRPQGSSELNGSSYGSAKHICPSNLSTSSAHEQDQPSSSTISTESLNAPLVRGSGRNLGQRTRQGPAAQNGSAGQARSAGPSAISESPFARVQKPGLPTGSLHPKPNAVGSRGTASGSRGRHWLSKFGYRGSASG